MQTKAQWLGPIIYVHCCPLTRLLGHGWFGKPGSREAVTLKLGDEEAAEQAGLLFLNSQGTLGGTGASGICNPAGSELTSRTPQATMEDVCVCVSTQLRASSVNVF